jgi:hypothetical protein
VSFLFRFFSFLVSGVLSACCLVALGVFEPRCSRYFRLLPHPALPTTPRSPSAFIAWSTYLYWRYHCFDATSPFSALLRGSPAVQGQCGIWMPVAQAKSVIFRSYVLPPMAIDIVHTSASAGEITRGKHKTSSPLRHQLISGTVCLIILVASLP